MGSVGETLGGRGTAPLSEAVADMRRKLLGSVGTDNSDSLAMREVLNSLLRNAPERRDRERTLAEGISPNRIYQDATNSSDKRFFENL